MTSLSFGTAVLRAEAACQLGPVLLAAKPFSRLNAPARIARWLAHREERDLRVVSVLEQHEELAIAAGCPPLSLDHYATERAELSAQLRDELESDGEDASRVEVDVISGESADGIVEAAKRSGARMIVIGSGKHDAVSRYVYGEHALDVLAAADRPVLIVPRGATAAPISVAVVAVDFSPESVRAARAVLPMMSAGGRLILAYVSPHDDSHGRTAEMFGAFRRALPALPTISLETRVLLGEPVRAILDLAAANQASLIACGRTSHSLIERICVGSVSSALVRKARCLVLVTPAAR